MSKRTEICENNINSNKTKAIQYTETIELAIKFITMIIDQGLLEYRRLRE